MILGCDIGRRRHSVAGLRQRAERRRFFGGGSAPAGNTTTTQTNQPWSGEEPYLSSIYQQAGNLYGNSIPKYYPADTYAQMNPIQYATAGNIVGADATGGTGAIKSADQTLSNTLSPNFTATTTPTFNAANGVLNNELSSNYLNPWNSPAFGSVVANTEASVLPQISSSFINGGRTDSGLATAAETQGLTNAVGNLAQSQYNTNQGIQNQAVAQASNNLLQQTGQQNQAAFYAPFVSGQETSNMSAALNAAGLPQQDQQNQINADVAQWNYNQMQPWNQLGLYEGAITGTGNPGGTSTTSQPYFSNTGANVMSGLSGLGSLALMGTMLFSDRNLKTDIHKIGETDSGFPLYTFRYKGDAPMAFRIGLMAQDVEKKRPEAVIHTPFGMAVDYAEALAA